MKLTLFAVVSRPNRRELANLAAMTQSSGALDSVRRAGEEYLITFTSVVFLNELLALSQISSVAYFYFEKGVDRFKMDLCQYLQIVVNSISLV